MRIVLLPSAFLVIALPTVTALSLSDFQPINGFSAQCTQSYNTPLQGCTTADFQSGHPCSTGCITFLEALTKMLNTDCKGTSAFPNTLIGLFFSQQGTSTLCPNVLGSSASGGGDQASYASAALPGATSTSQASEQQASTATPSAASTSPSSSGSVSQVSSSLNSAATSTTVVIAQTTITPSNFPTNNSPSPSNPSSTSSFSGSSTTSASQASSTAKNSNKGGGTILDLGSTAAAPPSMQLTSCSWALLGGSAVLAWLF